MGTKLTDFLLRFLHAESGFGAMLTRGDWVRSAEVSLFLFLKTIYFVIWCCVFVLLMDFVGFYLLLFFWN